LSPVSVSVPAVSVSPPEPSIAPPNVVEAFDSVSVLAPSVTLPVPDSVAIEVLPVSPEISKVPLSATPLESAIEPVPDSFSVPPLIVVAPV